MAEIIYSPDLEPGYRLRVVVDEDAEDPTTWGDHVVKGDDIHTRWAIDEVHIVVLEQEKVYVNPNDVTDTLTVWETEESLGGCYLNRNCTALTVAKEYWPHVFRT